MGALTKLRKVTVSFVMSFDRPSFHAEQLSSAGQIFMKLDISVFF